MSELCAYLPASPGDTDRKATTEMKMEGRKERKSEGRQTFKPLISASFPQVNKTSSNGLDEGWAGLDFRALMKDLKIILWALVRRLSMNVKNASCSHDYWLLKGNSLLFQTAESTDNQGLGIGPMLLCGGRQSPSAPRVGIKHLTDTQWVKHTNGLNWVGCFSSEMIKYLGLEWKSDPQWIFYSPITQLHFKHAEFH